MSSEEITRLLIRWRDGDTAAFDQLVPLVYRDLRRLAANQMRSERGDHTLQPTALLHEAFLRLIDLELEWTDRTHFLSMAARVMRRVLVDHARASRAGKRGHGAAVFSLDEDRERAASIAAGGDAASIVELDDALDRLEGLDARQAGIVELHYFAGLGYDEIAETLGISPATVGRELRVARAWLGRELAHDTEHHDTEE